MPFQEGPPGFGGSQIRLAMGLLPCEHLGGRVCCRTNVACSAIRIFSDEQRKCSCFIFLKPVLSSPGEPAPLSSRRKGCEQPWLLNVLGQMQSFQQSVQVFGEKCSTPPLCSSNHSGEGCVLHDPAILQGGRGDRVGRATVPCQCQRGAAGWDCRMDDDHWVWVSSWSLCCPLLPLWHTDRSLSG